MKKNLRDLELSIPTIDLLESRKIVGGYAGGEEDWPGTIVLDEIIITPDPDPTPDPGIDPHEYENDQDSNFDGQQDNESQDDTTEDNDSDNDQMANTAEILFAIRHPKAASDFKENSRIAIKLAIQAFPEEAKAGRVTDNILDAFRHCFWCALNTSMHGRELAEELGDAHEANQDDKDPSKIMDLHNNNVGYEIGEEAIKNNWDQDRIAKEVLMAMERHELITNIERE